MKNLATKLCRRAWAWLLCTAFEHDWKYRHQNAEGEKVFTCRRCPATRVALRSTAQEQQR